MHACGCLACAVERTEKERSASQTSVCACTSSSVYPSLKLIDETLAAWIPETQHLSDTQIFNELMRLLGLPEAVETRLMRAMVEAPLKRAHRPC